LICNPLATRDFNTACSNAPAISNESSFVSYDSLGADDGAIVGIVEGAEATAPFDHDIPIDAITVAIFDSLHHSPPAP
jgi:microcompartment protein CcmK/EutM